VSHVVTVTTPFGPHVYDVALAGATQATHSRLLVVVHSVLSHWFDEHLVQSEE
jgi:hypothetical protein